MADIQAFTDALKRHLQERVDTWAPEREGGDTESGFWTVGNVVDIDLLNAEIDEFVAIVAKSSQRA